MKNIDIQKHYSRTGLYSAILQALVESGIKNVKQEDFTRVDEFHIMGEVGTKMLADSLDLTSDTKVLDLGCGIGGASRFIVGKFNSEVIGVDLTSEYIETAKLITDQLGMEGLAFEQADALDLPFDKNTFDVVWTQHVQMNIKDKSKLLGEINRVLKPGGKLAFFDIFSSNNTELIFPLPWAEDSRISFTCSTDEWNDLLGWAGFEKEKLLYLSNDAIVWLEEFLKKAQTQGIPKVSPKLLMGDNTPIKLKNILQNLIENRCQLVLGIFMKSYKSK